jgi:hypothetical protein
VEELKIPVGCSDEDEIKARFKIVCRRCGSENIAINIEGLGVYLQRRNKKGKKP